MASKKRKIEEDEEVRFGWDDKNALLNSSIPTNSTISQISPQRNLVNATSWIDSLRRALDGVLPEEPPDDRQHAIESTKEIETPDLQLLLRKIKRLEQDVRDHNDRLAKAKEQLEAEEIAYGEMLQRSLQMHRGLSRRQDRMKASKGMVHTEEQTIASLREDIEALNRDLQERLTEDG